MDDENTPQHGAIADADLILRTRSGDAEAFGELWRRHYRSGMAVARSVTSSIDPDDLVQESYTRIYQAIIKGGGPNGSFRAYLFTSIRNTAAAWGRSRRESAIDELDTVADPDSTEQAANEALDRSLTAQAFRSLPSRWQEVLWYTEIEQMKPQEVAPLLGMRAGAVSQLAFRAREGLREAWIQAHLRSAEEGSDCQWTIEHLGAYSRGNLGVRDNKRLEQHLDECARCMIVAAEAKDVSTRLALVLLPLVLGIAGSTGYLATLQGGGAPIVALAAMPSGVVDGGVVVSGGASGGVAGGAGGPRAGGGSRDGAGSSSTGGASGGMLTGLGALVGAGSAALIVAGVVAAATILPGLVGADPSTSLPSAGEDGSSSISTDVGPDESMSSDEPVVIEAPAPTPPAQPEPEPPVEESAVPTVPESAGPAAAPPIVAPAPPEAPAQEVPDEEAPDEESPDEESPDEESPVLPDGIPTIVSAAVACVWDGTTLLPVTHYWVTVSGAPGATVQALLAGSTAGTTGAVLDAEGNGVVDIRPTFWQLIDDVPVQFHYSAVDAEGNTVAGEPTAAQGITELADPTGIACGGPEEGAVDEAPAADPQPAEESETPALDAAPETAEPAAAEPTEPAEQSAPVEQTTQAAQTSAEPTSTETGASEPPAAASADAASADAASADAASGADDAAPASAEEQSPAE